MSETTETDKGPERAFLVGVQTDKIPKGEAASLRAELGGLASSLSLDVAGSILVKLRERNAALLLGTGKYTSLETMREAGLAAAALEAGRVLVLDKAAVLAQARSWGISLLGFEPA